MTTEPIIPVILSGGAGTRLWPLSRRRRPKQFLPLAGETTMLAATLSRVADPGRFGSPLLIANAEHRFLVAEELRAGGVRPDAVLLEPEGRNTAPAVALAALRLERERPGAMMLLMPSDHVIADVPAFHAAIECARAAAGAGKLATFGVVPTHPETGYGYIERGVALAGCAGCYGVARFVEKPDRARAEAFLAAGRFFWNSGMFLFRAGDYLAELERYRPDILGACRSAMDGCVADGDFERPDAGAFAACPAESVDYAVMEKTGRAAVVPAELGWSDVGSWAALRDVAERDAAGNVVTGDILAEDCRNSLLRADGPAIAALGISDMVVIATSDMVLVAPIDRAQEVRRIVDRLAREGREEIL